MDMTTSLGLGCWTWPQQPALTMTPGLDDQPWPWLLDLASTTSLDLDSWTWPQLPALTLTPGLGVTSSGLDLNESP